MHYHLVDVAAVQDGLRGSAEAALADFLVIPLAQRAYTADEIKVELESNLHGLLGYVVRWIDQGVGVSAVPDLDGVRLMEDRATLRISSQLVANWLHHRVVGEAEVRETMRRVAAIVDKQNLGTQGYKPLGPSFDRLAYKAAEDLVFGGRDQPNGYVEAILST
jgi:malate synthase